MLGLFEAIFFGILCLCVIVLLILGGIVLWSISHIAWYLAIAFVVIVATLYWRARNTIYYKGPRV